VEATKANLYSVFCDESQPETPVPYRIAASKLQYGFRLGVKTTVPSHFLRFVPFSRQFSAARQIPVACLQLPILQNQQFKIGRSFALVFAMLDGLPNRIERYMDVLSTRQRQVAANIANADTPGYRTRDLDFQSELQRQMTGSAKPLPVLHEVAGLPVRNDGNNVSLDREARLLAENALRFNVASNLLRSQIRMVKSAIDEGKNG
jgi:flagellar basal-body rod protein FlgB